MIRLPSNQNSYDEYWSGDEAFVQLPDGATPAEREAHETKLRVARETGNWGELLIEGMQPTKFVVRPLSSEVHRRLMDELQASKLGGAQAMLIAFRAVLVEVHNLGDLKVKPVQHPDYGRLCALDVPDVLDRCAPGCISEIGGRALNRAAGLPGKS